MTWCAGIGVDLDPRPSSVQLATFSPPPDPVLEAEILNVSLLPMELTFTQTNSSDPKVADVSGKRQKISIPGRVSRYTARTPQRRTVTIAAIQPLSTGIATIMARFDVHDRNSQFQGICVADAPFLVN